MALIGAALLGLLLHQREGNELEERAADRLVLARDAARAVLEQTTARVGRAAATAAPALADAVATAGPGLPAVVALERRERDLDVLVVADTADDVVASSRGAASFAEGFVAPTDAALLRDPRRAGIVAVAEPVLDANGRRVGRLVAGVWVDAELLGRLAGKPAITYSLVASRRVVASTGDAGTTAPDVTPGPVARSAVGGADAFVVATAGPARTTLLVAVDAGRVLAPRDDLVVALLVGGVATAVAAGLAAWVTTTRLARRATAAAVARQAVADGPPVPDAAADPPPPAPDDAAVAGAALRNALDRLGEALAANSREAIVDVLLDTSVLLTRADAAVVWLVRGPALPYVVSAARGIEGDPSVPAGSGLPGLAVAADGPVLVPGTPGAATDRAEPPAAVAVGVPVHSRGRTVGVLALYRLHAADRPFTDVDAQALGALVRQAETGLENVLLREEAEHLSLTDGLTGVWNRRHLEMRGNEEVQRSRRFREPFGVVLIDVDDFKHVNDTYGHQAGDAVLVELAARLTEATREVDIIARYGGEEFALLLPRTDVGGSRLLAEKVRAAVAARPFDTGSVTLPVTVSAGLACHPEHGATMHALVSAADGALYRAKRSGKNQVVEADVGLEDAEG